MFRTTSFATLLVTCSLAVAQDPGNGNGEGNAQNNGNGNGQNNGQNNRDQINLVPGFGDGGGGNQTDPLTRYLIIKDAYRNNNFNAAPPVDASARSQVDQDFYLKYALAAFDVFKAFRNRVVNEQTFVVKTIKDADRVNRREQKELTKEQALTSRRNALSRLVEAMNALPTPKNVVATGRPLNAYLDRVNQAGSFGGLLTVGAGDAFKLLRPDAVRISTGVGDRAVRLPIVGTTVPFHPPMFLSAEGTLKSGLDAYTEARKSAVDAKEKAESIAIAQDALNTLDSEIAARHRGMKVQSIKDEFYQESVAWKKFAAEERKLLGWLGANSRLDLFDGKTVVDLLMYLRRNGYAFAAADPGDEDAYAALHQQLRDLSLKASEEPASQLKERMEGFVEQTDRLRERLPPAAPAATVPLVPPIGLPK